MPAWEGMLLSTSATVSGTVVNATCASGYYFPDDGPVTKTTTCNATGQWNPEINDCVGKFKVFGLCKYVGLVLMVAKGNDFPDNGPFTKKTLCNATGQWNQEINDCHG